jgi:polysaccharide export outer membrane protein
MIAILMGYLILFSGSLFSQERITSDYQIGPRDLIEVTVFGAPEMNRKERVPETGRITFPLLGEVDVAGLTKLELEKKLTQLLGEKLLQNPQVTVSILEYQSKRVFVLGAIRNPGPYELQGRQTLLHAIAEAGGLIPEAGNEIIITRKLSEGTTKSLRISVEDLVLKGADSLNIPLQPDDIINIPVDKIIQIYVIGQVRNPGALEQIRKSNIPTLLQAIARAGGFSDRASKGSVIIKRKDQTGREVQLKFDVDDIIKGKKKDVQLQENDVVIVPEKFI